MSRSSPLFLALVLPGLLAYNVSPSATLLNSLLALAGWGLVLLMVGVRPQRALARSPGLWAALALMAGAVAWSMHGALPGSLGWSSLGLLTAAAAVAWHGSADEAPDESLIHLFCSLLLAGGLASALIGLIQVFAPELADGQWIARSGLEGRAVGNLRQPNHLSSLLMWGLVAWVPLAQVGRVGPWRLPLPAALLIAGLLLWAVVLTASRTGIAGVVLLGLWGIADRRLRRPVRLALLAAPLSYLLIGLGMSAWAHLTGEVFGGEARIVQGNLSPSRWAIWADTLTLIGGQPWSGVGWGQFNFAWTLTPLPQRPVAFFDHSHNLPLQLWVELGLPLGSLVLAGLLWALAQAGWRSWKVPGDLGVASRAAFMVVLMIGVHSLSEYPLWYAYFLLPTAWAWGYALRLPPRGGDGHWQPQAVSHGATLRLAGVLLLAGSAFALWDYGKAVAIYSPGPNAGPLAERIERGQHSLLFAHHADYAAATNTEPPSLALGAFAGTTHSLLDARLMMAWARALDESGHREQASYVAARLKEFRNPAAEPFFAPCAASQDLPEARRPFQCVAPPPGLGWRDFLPQLP